MKLKLVVEFSFIDYGHWLHPEKPLSNIQELREYVAANAKSEFSEPNEIEVRRILKLIDLDRNIEDMSKREQFKYIISDAKPIDGHPVEAVFNGGNFRFIMPRLMYPSDVRKYLIDYYGSTLNFTPESEFTPVIFNVIEEDKRTGLRNSKTGEPTYYTLYSVNWRPLTNQDVVVNEKMRQIYPLNANHGRTPRGLVELLNKKHEKVY